jgi:hypothetical protein
MDHETRKHIKHQVNLAQRVRIAATKRETQDEFFAKLDAEAKTAYKVKWKKNNRIKIWESKGFALVGFDSVRCTSCGLVTLRRASSGKRHKPDCSNNAR